MKGKVDKLDTDKSVHVPDDLIKASEAVRNVIKKTEYDKLLKKLMLFKLLILKRYDALLGRMHFTGNNGFQKFQVFAQLLNSLIFDRNKNVINWMLTGISSERIKPFDTNIEPKISSLDNVKLKI